MWLIPFLLAVAGAVIVHLRSASRIKETESRARGEVENARREIEDLTRRIEGEQSRQRALFDSMIEGVLVIDGTMRVRLANKALINLFNISSDPSGGTIMEAIRSHELQALVKQAQAEGPLLNQEFELPGLKERAFQINATPISLGGGAGQGVLLVIHDLTRVRELENTRRDFVANVSHELRTPLSMIKGYVETLGDGAWQDAEAAPRFLQIIHKHVQRLTFLIEDLLTISQLESGQIAMSMQAVDLSALAAKVIEDLRDHARSRKTRLVNEIGPGIVIDGDADRLQQVFFNLVENAIKYGRPEGTVTLKAEPAEAGRVKCCVLDDGPGIPEEALGRIFERFYRLDRARSRDAGGTGLGLSIVKHIVQAHGGDVWAESETGKGSRFYLTLQRV